MMPLDRLNNSCSIVALVVATAVFFSASVVGAVPPPAPALNLTVTTSLYEAVRFLFEVEPLVQRDLVPGTIIPMRVSHVRGIVLGSDNLPRAGVRVDVLSHPEFGWTLTREDGRYDLVVNGGNQLVLNFTEANRMAVHRKWNPPWNETQELPPVKMLGLDTTSTVINFSQKNQVHRATGVIDGDGKRRATLMFRSGTIASLVLPNGKKQQVKQLTVRATEFTVGPNGPAAMPAELPQGTQYTYAVEFTADEAEAVGAQTVEFNPPAVLYVENFLRIPVGTVVPGGSYNRVDAQWSTEPNGRVIRIVGNEPNPGPRASGPAILDITGEGNHATDDELAAAGIHREERIMLSRLYRVRQELTRMPVPHFTRPLDANFTGRPSDDATEPPEDGPDENQEEDCHHVRDGSIIECENQILGQRLEIPGTAFSLNYRTSRVPGAPSRHLRIPITGGSVPASLRRARLDVTVAARTFSTTFEHPTPGQSHIFSWDGLDAYGRPVQGAQPTRVCLTYDYPATYAGTNRAIDENVFGDWLQDGVAVPGRSNSEVGLSRCYSRGLYAGARNSGTINKANMLRLGGLDARTSSAGLGGWTLSVHHTLGLETGTLYLGTGEKRELGDSRHPVAVRVAGNGWPDGSPTGPSAVGAAVVSPQSVAVGGDGSIYIGSPGRVRRVTLDGALEAVAGTGVPGFAGDGGPATAAQVSTDIVALDVGPDGSVYIADAGNRRIRRVGPDGIMTTIAGNGNSVPADAGMNNGQGSALATTLPCLQDITLTDGGSQLWMVNSCGSTGDQRIQRLFLVSNTIHHVAGFPYPTWLDAANDRPKILVPDQSPAIFGWDASTLGDSVMADGRRLNFAGKWALLRRPRAFAFDKSGSVMYVAGDPNPSFNNGTEGRIRKLPLSGWGISTYRQDYSISKNKDGIFDCNSNGCGGHWTFQGDGILSPINDIGLLPGRGIAILTRLEDDTLRVRLAPSKPGSAITDLMGGGTNTIDGEDLITPAQNLRIRQIVNRGMAIGPDGSIYVNDTGGHKVVKLANGAPGIYGAATIPSEDGSELYEFDEQGRHLRTLNGLTNDVIWVFHYDQQGRLLEVVDADGDTTTILRNDAGDATGIRSSDGVLTTLSLDEHGYVDQIAYPTGSVYGFTNREDGIMMSMTTPRRFVHQFQYDALGRLERDEDPAGGVQTLEHLDVNENEYHVEHRTALGRTTTYEVSRSAASERTRTQHHPDGTTSSQAELANQITRTTSRNGTVVETKIGADPRLGHLVSVPERTTITTPSGLAGMLTTSVSSTTAGGANSLVASEVTQQVVVQQDSSRTHTMRYRAATGQNSAEVVQRSPENRAIRTRLGQHGRIDRVQLGTWSNGAFVPSSFHELVFGYDQRGRLTTVTQGSGDSVRTTNYHYNDQGFVDQVTDPGGQAYTVGHDGAGRPTTVTLPDGQQIGLTYDPDGNLSGVTPPGKPQHTLTSNGVDDLERYTPPDVLPGEDATQYSYDDDHALTDILQPDGRNPHFAYDDAGRLSSVQTPSRNIAVAYHPGTGQFRSFTEPDGGTTEYQWDGPLLVGVQRSGSFTGAVTWTYGADFRLQSETVTGTTSISYDYDHDDLLTRAGTETITRHPVSGAISGTALGGVASAITYSNFGELASLAYSHGGTSLYTASYVRDALGRLQRKTEAIGGVSVEEQYVYDAAGRLDRVERDGVETFNAAYDGNGNRTQLLTPSGTRVASYDAQDRLLSDGTLLFTYTAVGDLLTRTDTSTNQVTTYAYDEGGALLSVQLPTGTEITYVVDGMGRRIGKRVNGVLDRGWLYGRQIGPIAELDARGAIRSRFVYGSRPHVPDYMEQGGETFRFVTDHLGSIRLVVNVVNGNVVQRIDYDPWGVVTQDTNPGFQPFGYAGGLYDPDTGLVRFGLRDYDATTSRWTSKDPIGFGGGDTDLYVYGAGDPINLLDPTGTELYEYLGWIDSSGLDDFVAGFGDTLSMGISADVREMLDWSSGVVNNCSAVYRGGTWVGTAYSIALGGVSGFRAAGTKAVGKEFSHWIPDRTLKQHGRWIRNTFGRSRWNGNYVPRETHALSDMYRYRFMPRVWKADNPMPNIAFQQWTRIPNVYKGGAGGAAYGSAGAVRSRCACSL